MQPAVLQVEVSEIVVHEADEPNVGVDLAQAELLAAEDLRDEELPAMERDGAALGGDGREVVERIGELGQAGEGPRRGGVAADRVAISSASCGRRVLNSSTKASKRACCARLFCAAGRVVSCLSVRCMRSWRPFCCGLPGLVRSIAMPSRSHQTASLESP